MVSNLPSTSVTNSILKVQEDLPKVITGDLKDDFTTSDLLSHVSLHPKKVFPESSPLRFKLTLINFTALQYFQVFLCKFAGMIPGYSLLKLCSGLHIKIKLSSYFQFIKLIAHTTYVFYPPFQACFQATIFKSSKI